MPVRPVVEKDIPRIQEMLAAAGQPASEAAIRWRIEDSSIIGALYETGGGVIKGFCFVKFRPPNAGVGPMSAPANARTWLRIATEMWKWIDDKAKLQPAFDDATILRFLMGPRFDHIRKLVKRELQLEVPDDGEGIEERPDGPWIFYFRWRRLIRRIRELTP